MSTTYEAAAQDAIGQGRTGGIPTGIAYPPPPSPGTGVDWGADPARSVLLVHDMQDHFVNKYDRDAEPILSVIDAIRRLVPAAREAGVPVVFSAQPGDQDPAERGLLTDFWGTGPRTEHIGVVPELGPVPPEELMRKWRYSAFQRTDLGRRFTGGRDTLVVCGIYANIGIKSTALEAFMSDVRPVVIADAVADFDPDEHRAALDWIGRRCGAVASTGDVLTAWGPDDAASTARALAAEVLEVAPDALEPQTDLVDAGLDSVRAMELADRLQDAGIEVPFETLVAARTMAEWDLA